MADTYDFAHATRYAPSDDEIESLENGTYVPPKDDTVYLPTPEEIRKATAQIRAEWPEGTWETRLMYKNPPARTPQAKEPGILNPNRSPL